MLHGTGFALDFGGGKPVCGFYRNVYVLAVNAASAIDRAKQAEVDTMRTGEYAESFRDITVANLDVEEIEESWAYWKLLLREGHAFYNDLDDNDQSERKPS
jgi:hypothetical protein